jgi:hypothetical protein
MDSIFPRFITNVTRKYLGTESRYLRSALLSHRENLLRILEGKPVILADISVCSDKYRYKGKVVPMLNEVPRHGDRCKEEWTYSST